MYFEICKKFDKEIDTDEFNKVLTFLGQLDRSRIISFNIKS